MKKFHPRAGLEWEPCEVSGAVGLGPWGGVAAAKFGIGMDPTLIPSFGAMCRRIEL